MSEVRIFLWKRAMGLAMILDGLLYVFTPKRTGLPLACAKRIARIRGRRLVSS